MTSPAGPRPPRSFWPAAIIAFFALAILGFGSFIAFCNLHPAELVAPDYYEQEVRYQGQIDRRTRSEHLAEPAAIAYDPARRLIRIALPTSQAGAITNGQIELYRPSAAGLDHQLALKPDSAGIQSVDASTLSPGLWRVKVMWSAGGMDYSLEQKITNVAPALPAVAK